MFELALSLCLSHFLSLEGTLCHSSHDKLPLKQSILNNTIANEAHLEKSIFTSHEMHTRMSCVPLSFFLHFLHHCFFPPFRSQNSPVGCTRVNLWKISAFCSVFWKCSCLFCHCVVSSHKSKATTKGIQFWNRIHWVKLEHWAHFQKTICYLKIERMNEKKGVFH